LIVQFEIQYPKISKAQQGKLAQIFKFEENQVESGRLLPISKSPESHQNSEVLQIPNESEQSNDLLYSLPLTLEEIAQGCSKQVKIRQIILQSRCLINEAEKHFTVDVKRGIVSGTRIRFPG